MSTSTEKTQSATPTDANLLDRQTSFVNDIHAPSVSQLTPLGGEIYVAPTNSANVAALGADAAFAETICVGRPNTPDRDKFMARMENILESGRLTNLGPRVLEFEDRVATIAGTRHCVATCNATTGLELAISALGMKGEVIVPSFTFVGTVHALWRQGIRTVFCDIDPLTHCLDPDCVEDAITSHTTGILAVHMWGNSAATRALQDIAERHDLRLLFDAAHAFACGTRQRAVGSFGDAEVFSFHATKFVHSFEGGAIVTDNGELAERLRLMTNFGFADEDDVQHLGMNGKMSEASAAMGLTSLESMNAIMGHNRDIYAAYAAGFEKLPGISTMHRDYDEPQNYHYVVTEVNESVTGLSRDELVSALRLENIIARRYFYPGCHRMAPYKGMFPQAGRMLPVTEALAERVMILPTGLSVTEADVSVLCGRVANILQHSGAVRTALLQCDDSRLPSFARHRQSGRR